MLSTAELRRFVFASSMGTFLEYLDFSLYAFSATIIAYHFFPESDPSAGLVKAWGVSFCGFLCRPFGAVFFGHVGDKFGAKLSLLISMTLMSLATILMGIIPTYKEVGVLAPLLLIICRMTQGFAFSAEYNGVATYLSLNNLKKKLGFYSSVTIAVIGLGSLCGGLIMSYATQGFVPDTVPELNWRLPFVLSGVFVGLFGLFLRRNMPSVTPKVKEKVPLISTLREQKISLTLCVFLAGFVGLKSYSIFNFIPSFLQVKLGLSISESLIVASYCNIAMMVATVAAGWLSDNVGRAKIINISLIGMIMFSLLAFYVFENRYYNLITSTMIGLSIASGMFSGGIPAFFAELFKEKQRFTGSALGYNLGVSLVGGATPLVMTLVSQYSMLAPAYIICGYSILIISVFGFLKMKGYQYGVKNAA